MVDKELENARVALEEKINKLLKDKTDAMSRYDDAIERERIKLLAFNDIVHASAEQRSFVPEKGETYYYIDDCMGCLETEWMGTPRDKSRLKAHNVYASKEQCEFECEAAKVEAELREYTCADTNRESYFILVREGVPGGGCNLVLVEVEHPVGGKIFFSSQSVGRGAIALVGEERVKKYYARPRIGRYWEDPAASSEKVNDTDGSYESATREYKRKFKFSIEDRID